MTHVGTLKSCLFEIILVTNGSLFERAGINNVILTPSVQEAGTWLSSEADGRGEKNTTCKVRKLGVSRVMH